MHAFWLPVTIEPRRTPLRNMRFDIFGQDLVDQSLVAHFPPLRLFAESIQDLWIDPDRDQSTCRIAEWWAPDTTHGAQLLVRRLGDVREVNRPTCSRTQPFPCDSRASR